MGITLQESPKFITLHTHQISDYIKDFVELSGISKLEDISRKHKFHPALSFYFKHKNSDWRELTIPSQVLELANDIVSIVSHRQMILDASKGKPAKIFQKQDLIETCAVEAMIVSHFKSRGYDVSWPSIFNQDPPDIIVRDATGDFAVDIEVKVKERCGSIETMFDSFSKGLQSLKDRRKPSKMSVVVIQNSSDLNWAEWLSSNDVSTRLRSRLVTDDYKIVSGVVFSGGYEIKKDDMVTSYATKFVAFRFNQAANPLPYGFLTDTKNI